MTEIEAFPTKEAAAEEAASAIAAALRDAAAATGRASFVATGGRSPGPVYDRLVAASVPWSQVDVTLSDERWVDPASPESNQRLLEERLFRGPVRACRFTPLKTDAPTAQAGAAAVEGSVAALLPFDVALLGMGEDGHVASLFPGNPALAEGLTGERLVIAAPAGSPAPAQDRVSLTLKALRTARRILVLIGGEAKRRMIEQGHDRPIHVLADQAPVRVLWSPQ